MSLGEELHRKRQDVPYQLADHRHRELGLDPQQQRLLKRSHQRPRHGGDRHADQQGREPALDMLDQDVVDKDLCECRNQYGRHHERHAEGNQQQHRPQ